MFQFVNLHLAQLGWFAFSSSVLPRHTNALAHDAAGRPPVIPRDVLRIQPNCIREAGRVKLMLSQGKRDFEPRAVSDHARG